MEAQGTVKWYNAEKGFGFIGLENGEKDVFVHATAVTRSGLTTLKEGQELTVVFGAGKKGPEARSVRFERVVSKRTRTGCVCHRQVFNSTSTSWL